MTRRSHNPLAALTAGFSAVAACLLRLLFSTAVVLVGSLFLLHSSLHERRHSSC